MYNPYNCDLYVAIPGGSNYDLDALVKKIDSMSPPLLEQEWRGDSSPSWDTFLSPMARTTQDVRRARCRGTIYRTSSATTVPYSHHSSSSERRPAGKLGIEGHIEAGRIIKAVLRSNYMTYAVYSRLNSLRSTLEDWMAFEIERGQLEGTDFFDVYYNEVDEDALYDEMTKLRTDIIEILGRLKQKLKAAYPDCAPLRKQLHRIDMSVSLMTK